VSAGKARSTPWSVDHKWVVTLFQRAQKDGLCWAKSAHRRRSSACPMPRIALRVAPSRMNGFVTIKRVKDYFLWYYSLPALLQYKAILFAI